MVKSFSQIVQESRANARNRSVDEAIETLLGRNSLNRFEALQTLVYTEPLPATAVDAFVACLSDELDSMRSVAAWKLYRKYSELPNSAIEPLTSCLSRTSNACLPVLCCLRDRFTELPGSVLDQIVDLLEHPRELVRDAAIGTVQAHFSDVPEEHHEAFADRLDDESDMIRLGASHVLATLCDDVSETIRAKMREQLAVEQVPIIKAVLVVAMCIHQQDSPLLIPCLFNSMSLDVAFLREEGIGLLAASEVIPQDDFGQFAKLCLPRAFHAEAGIDMPSAVEVIQFDPLVARLRSLARMKYLPRKSDFLSLDEIVEAMQSQFSFVASKSPSFGTSLSNYLHLLDNAVKRVDSAFSYEFRSRFQGFSHRRQNRWQHDPILPADFSTFVNQQVPSLGFADAAHREVVEFLREAIEKLDDRRRHIVVSRYLQGLTWEQIAQELSLSVSAVQYQHSQALSDLRAWLPTEAAE